MKTEILPKGYTIEPYAGTKRTVIHGQLCELVTLTKLENECLARARRATSVKNLQIVREGEFSIIFARGTVYRDNGYKRWIFNSPSVHIIRGNKAYGFTCGEWGLLQ